MAITSSRDVRDDLAAEIAPGLDPAAIATSRWYHRGGRSAWYGVERAADGSLLGWIVDPARPERDGAGRFRPEAIERIRDVVRDATFAPASVREIQAAHREWDAEERVSSALPRRSLVWLLLWLLLLAALVAGGVMLTAGGSKAQAAHVFAPRLERRPPVVAPPAKAPPSRGGPSRVVVQRRPAPPVHVAAAQPAPSSPAPSSPAPRPKRRSSVGCGVYSGSGLCG